MASIEHDRLTSAESAGEDKAFDRAIRPRKLSDYRGQPNVSAQMGVFIEAARRRVEEVFRRLDMNDFGDRRCDKLSTFSPVRSPSSPGTPPAERRERGCGAAAGARDPAIPGDRSTAAAARPQRS